MTLPEGSLRLGKAIGILLCAAILASDPISMSRWSEDRGVNDDHFQSFEQLIEDVQAGVADFSTILVYEISRWGRFQDADESAYYEYICKRAGTSVRYCAEQFENDGSPVSAIVKGVKRAMAGEYSRELSVSSFSVSRNRKRAPPDAILPLWINLEAFAYALLRNK